MSRLSKIVSTLLGLAALMILTFILAGMFSSMQQPAVTSELTIASVTALPYPPPSTTDTPTAISSAYPPPLMPTVTLQSTPSAIPTTEQPTEIPTAVTLPQGATLLYKELQDANVVIWAASASNVKLRRSAFTVVDESRFGIRVSMSHDRTKIAYTKLPFGRGNNPLAAELWMAGLYGLQPKLLASQVDIGRYVNYPLWSPNDQQIVVSRQSALEAPYIQSIVIVDIVTRKEQTLITASDTNWLWPLEWSPDGKYFYYMLGSGSQFELRRVNLSQTNISETIHIIVAEMTPRCYFLSSDGGHLLCTVLQTRKPINYAVMVVPTQKTESIEVLVSGAQDELYNPIWSPDGQEIILNIPPENPGGRAELHSINLKDRQQRTLAISQEGPFIPQGWSADGQWVVVKKLTDGGSELFLISRDGSKTSSILSAGELEFIGWLP